MITNLLYSIRKQTKVQNGFKTSVKGYNGANVGMVRFHKSGSKVIMINYEIINVSRFPLYILLYGWVYFVCVSAGYKQWQ